LTRDDTQDPGFTAARGNVERCGEQDRLLRPRASAGVPASRGRDDCWGTRQRGSYRGLEATFRPERLFPAERTAEVRSSPVSAFHPSRRAATSLLSPRGDHDRRGVDGANRCVQPGHRSGAAEPLPTSSSASAYLDVTTFECPLRSAKGHEQPLSKRHVGPHVEPPVGRRHGRATLCLQPDTAGNRRVTFTLSPPPFVTPPPPPIPPSSGERRGTGQATISGDERLHARNRSSGGLRGPTT